MVTDSFDPDPKSGSVSETKEIWITDSSEVSGAITPEDLFKKFHENSNYSVIPEHRARNRLTSRVLPENST